MEPSHRKIDLKKALFQATGLGTVSPTTPSTATAYLSRLFDPSTTTLADFVNALFKTAIIAGAILAVLQLGYAGFKYMASDLPGVKNDARERIGRATLGLLLLLSIWLILYQINPDILKLDFLDSVPKPPQTAAAGRVLGQI